MNGSVVILDISATYRDDGKEKVACYGIDWMYRKGL